MTPRSYLDKAANEVERLRRLADYTGDDIDSERAAWVVEQAQAFYEAVQEQFAATD